MSNSILDRFPSELKSLIPQDELSLSALSLAHSNLPTTIFNHSLRVYLYSSWLANRESTPVSNPLLFVACILHDLGASDSYNGPQRFEIEGADAASDHCKHHSLPDSDCHKVWTAIALHTTPGVAERIDPFTRLVRLGVKLDFSTNTRADLNANTYAAEIELILPRLDVEKCLGDTVVAQAREKQKVDKTTWPDNVKHPKASWPGILLRAAMENPEHEGVNLAF